ncbi:hypothetical protein ACFZAU_40950 [Streptomyces sp. NPDC008238]
MLGKEKKAPGSGRMWRAAVPAEERALITSTIASVEEQLLQLRGVQTAGPAADVARTPTTAEPPRSPQNSSRLVTPHDLAQLGVECA